MTYATVLSGVFTSLFVLALTHSHTKPEVKLIKTKDGFELRKNGVKFFIKGVGGNGDRTLLVKSGANSFRTWGAENIGTILDEAQKDGLMVTVGIWLQHSDAWDYRNAAEVKKQFEECKAVVTKHKGHPALLMWAFGNEMEGYANGDDPRVWNAVEDIAKMSKQVDPDHPTMTVIAEIGGGRVPSIHKYCPSIDVIGINSYGGAPTLGKRYKEAGGTKPYIITEFGPPGPWEMPKTRWDAPIELDSTAKATAFSNAYKGSIQSEGLCLGSYAFLWGNKQEGTATWFGMLLPDGSKLGAVDVLTEFWTGKKPAITCPVIMEYKLDATDHLKPGQTINATLTVSDPQSKPLTVRWILKEETKVRLTAGRDEAISKEFPESIISASTSGAKVKVPTTPGAYRLFVYVSNGVGSATANTPILVEDITHER